MLPININWSAVALGATVTVAVVGTFLGFCFQLYNLYTGGSL